MTASSDGTLPLEDDVFGDAEPEDAWCPTDTTPVLLNNLARRLAAVLGIGALERLDTEAPEYRAALVRLWESLNVLARYADDHADDRTPAELLRLAMLREDLEHVRRRLEDGTDG